MSEHAERFRAWLEFVERGSRTRRELDRLQQETERLRAWLAEHNVCHEQMDRLDEKIIEFQQENERLQGVVDPTTPWERNARKADLILAYRRLQQETERLRARLNVSEAQVAAMQTMALETGHYTAAQKPLVARLHRIEEAARDCVAKYSDPDTWDDDTMAASWDALRTALTEEVGE